MKVASSFGNNQSFPLEEGLQSSKKQRRKSNSIIWSIVQDLALILIVDPDTKPTHNKNHNLIAVVQAIEVKITRSNVERRGYCISFMKFPKARGLVDSRKKKHIVAVVLQCSNPTLMRLWWYSATKQDRAPCGATATNYLWWSGLILSDIMYF